jgi:hypothetical protein
MQDLREFRMQMLARPDTEEGALERLVSFANIANFAVDVAKKREERMADNRCPLCGNILAMGDFDGKPESYLDEFHISGLCPDCQDDVFAENQEEVE